MRLGVRSSDRVAPHHPRSSSAVYTTAGNASSRRWPSVVVRDAV
ncbi:unnamed protein product [Amoebophrya sp. A25]|nr:unnamed protein product [Amoebophrya sp. A25]|eukprot:GSA25T00012043001.1